MAVGDILDVTAAVGINNTTLQLRNTLASEITKHVEVQQTLVTDLAQLTDGATVVIFNPANLKALSQTMTGNYMSGVDITLTDSVLAGYGATEMFTVSVNDTSDFTAGSSNPFCNCSRMMMASPSPMGSSATAPHTPPSKPL